MLGGDARGKAGDVVGKVGGDVGQDIGGDIGQDASRDAGKDAFEDIGLDEEFPMDGLVDAIRKVPIQVVWYLVEGCQTMLM